MSSRVLTFAGFAVIVGAAIAWTVVTATRRGLPTIGEAFAALTRTRLARTIAVLGWAWIGWHLFVRTSVFD
jgi:hypothetical protein